ncbi:MAG: citrate/2-methylcitrate synthase [Leifsonia sp.]
MTAELPALTAEQTAERLGIKLETLYAYVARGRLTRARTPSGSTFDPREVERFAAARRQRAAAAPSAERGHSDGRPLMVIDTTFAHIEDDELLYRDRDAVELAQTTSFETVARWALTAQWDAEASFAAHPSAVDQARHVTAAMPPAATHRDRQQVAVTVLAAADPLRYTLDPVAVASAAESLVAGMVDVLPIVSGAALPAAREASIAARLWPRLTAHPATPQALHQLNAALVLLIDHDLAISTLAARAAASARANAYAVVTTGLGALDSPLHGNASRATHRMLARVVAGEHPERAIADTMISGRGAVPGFGHALYRRGDPRGRALLEMLRERSGAAAVLEAAERVSAVVGSRTGTHPNVDFALAAISLADGMPDDAGEVVFATARTIGWVLHALDEYSRPALRLRPVGRYTS